MCAHFLYNQELFISAGKKKKNSQKLLYVLFFYIIKVKRNKMFYVDIITVNTFALVLQLNFATRITVNQSL